MTTSVWIFSRFWRDQLVAHDKQAILFVLAGFDVVGGAPSEIRGTPPG